ncbi:MAG: amino acid permease [Bifidobacterium longum]
MAAAGTPKDDTGLERKMESRHLTMISLGGVIGTGLFVSSGYAIHQAGPLGAILAYAAGSLLVYCVMVSLGELSVAMPYAGSFHMYAKRFIGPGTAFTIAVLYWLNWAVALASEFTAAGLLMQRWFPHSPSWVWSAVFIVVVFALNIMVWSLAKERLIPARFAKTNFRGVPVWAVLFSMAGSLLALLSSVLAASTVYLVLVAVSGLATLVVWFSVCVCHIRFRREWARDGHSADELGYRAPGFPVLPWLAIVMCIGALVLVVLDDTQRSTLYCMIPFVACCYAAYYALERQRKREKNT